MNVIVQDRAGVKVTFYLAPRDAWQMVWKCALYLLIGQWFEQAQGGGK